VCAKLDIYSFIFKQGDGSWCIMVLDV
jgi:hypothetical protein